MIGYHKRENREQKLNKMPHLNTIMNI